MTTFPPGPSEPAEPVVYVVTDLGAPEPAPAPANPYAALWVALRPLLGLGLVVVPLLAATGLLAGLLLGWHPVALAVAAVLGAPVLIGLADLLGARLGWPPLEWTAARLTARRPADPATTTQTETAGE